MNVRNMDLVITGTTAEMGICLKSHIGRGKAGL